MLCQLTFVRSRHFLSFIQRFGLHIKNLISLYTLTLHNALSVVLWFVFISFKSLYISLRFLSDGEGELATFFQTSRWVDSSTLGSVRVNLFELAYERGHAIFNSGEQTLLAEEKDTKVLHTLCSLILFLVVILAHNSLQSSVFLSWYKRNFTFLTYSNVPTKAFLLCFFSTTIWDNNCLTGRPAKTRLDQQV